MILPKTLFANQDYFGLAINRTSLRALSLNNNGKVTSYAQIPLDKSVFNGGVIQVDTLVPYLQKLKTQGKFSSPYASVIIPESYAFSREYTLPALPLSEIGEAITWQLNKIFPFAPEEIYSDWKLLKSDDKQNTLLVVAAQKKLLDGLRVALEKAEIYPISFEPSVSAISRLLANKGHTTLGLIEADSRGSTATLVENGISLLTTTSNTSTNKNLATAISESINALLRYYVEKNRVATDKLQFFLTGERADKNLAATLTSQLKRQISILSIDNITPPFHQSYAAASSQVLPPKSEESINLIPTQLQEIYENQLKHKLFKNTFTISLSLLIVSLVLAGSNFALQVFSNNRVKSQLILLQRQDQASQTEIPVQTLAKKATRIKTLFPLKVTPQEEIITAISMIPETIILENINYNLGKLQFKISGIAKNRQDLLLLRTNLEESELFENAHLPLGAFESSENVNFLMDFNLKTQKP